MRSFDFSPLYRSTIGFDPFFDLFDRIFSNETNQSGYPPFNIEKIGDDHYRISIAAAGFTEDDLNIEVRDHELIVSGRKERDDENRVFLHRGIAERAFEKRFQLADYVKVVDATLENGMLHIDLVREVPEALRPRRIEIRTPGGKTIEGKAVEAGKAEAKKLEKAEQ
ncbi:MAG: heat-shock protein [Alphaproteobacteria bacterium]|nr:MAG: heat-shock protein [Alphaproteobacteria bacterium]